MSSGAFSPVASTGENCRLHPFETADRICSACGSWHCDACLVTPWGPRKPALCVACAIERGGVRKNASARQSRSTREIRQVERQRKKEARDQARRPLAVSPVELEKVDFPDAPTKGGLLSRLTRSSDG